MLVSEPAVPAANPSLPLSVIAPACLLVCVFVCTWPYLHFCLRRIGCALVPVRACVRVYTHTLTVTTVCPVPSAHFIHCGHS